MKWIQFCCDKLSGSSETGGSKFLNCQLGRAMDNSYSPVLSRNCPKCVLVFFRRGLPRMECNTSPVFLTLLSFAMTLLSLLCLRRILPFLGQMYFQLNCFLSSLAKENKCLFLLVRFSLMKTRSEVGFSGALLFNFLLSLYLLFLVLLETNLTIMLGVLFVFDLSSLWAISISSCDIFSSIFFSTFRTLLSVSALFSLSLMGIPFISKFCLLPYCSKSLISNSREDILFSSNWFFSLRELFSSLRPLISLCRCFTSMDTVLRVLAILHIGLELTQA